NVADTLTLKAGKNSHLISLFDMSNSGYYGQQAVASANAPVNDYAIAGAEQTIATITSRQDPIAAPKVKEPKMIPDDVIDYTSFGIAASIGSGSFAEEGAIADALEFIGKTTWQAEALLGFNKGTQRSVFGVSLGIANYVDPWSFDEEAPDKTTDLSLGLLGKFYVAPTKGYYLTGFNFFFQPSVRYSISNNLKYSFEDYDDYGYTTETYEHSKPFDIGIKTGVGYTFPMSPDKMSRLGISIFGDAGVLERSDWGTKQVVFGLQLEDDI